MVLFLVWRRGCEGLALILALYFSPENVVCLLHLLHINVLKTNFIMKASTMNPDQTAPKKQSDMGPYCFQYRL